MHHQMEVSDAAVVVQLAEECGDGALIYVASAGQFRYVDIASPASAFATEDVWAPHVARLATELATNIAKSSYALLDVGHVPPMKEENVARLEGIPGRVISLVISNDTAKLARAVMNVRADNPPSLDAALAAIATSKVNAKASALLQATALHHAERYVGAWGALARFWDDWIAKADNNVLVELARIAVDAGETTKANQALSALNVDVLSIELVELVLSASRRAGARTKEEQLIERLKALSPNSELLSEHLINRALGTRDWHQLGILAVDISLNIEPAERRYLRALADGLLGEDLAKSAMRLASEFADRGPMIYLLVGRELTRRRLYPQAIAILAAVPSATPEASRAAFLILDTLESVLLERTPTGGFAIPDTMLATLVGFVASQAATTPRDAKLRVKLAQLLAAELVGNRGEGLLLFLIEHLATQQQQEEPLVVDDASLEEAKEFLDLVAEMTETSHPQRALVIGVGELPPSISVEKARRLLPILPQALDHMLQDLTSERDVASAKLVLHAALLACERSGSRRDGVFMLGMTAVHFATMGWSQEARDTAEHALGWVREHPDELRLAWIVFADVYHRLGNLHEALVGMLLAVSLQEAKLRTDETWHETHLLLRLLRDLGLHDEALAMIDRAETMLMMTPRWKARLESMKLAVELRRHDATPRAVPDILLMERLAVNVRQLKDLDDDVAPPLVLLMQLLARASVAGTEVPVELQEIVQSALLAISPTLAARLKALGEPNPDLSTVQSLTTRIWNSRFSEDVGYDIQAGALVAQRALSRAETLPPWSVVEIIELLTDRTLVSPASIGDQAALRSTIDRLLACGHLVHLLGLDESGSLVRATIEIGKDPEIHREPHSVFDPATFNEWKKSYPYRYCLMDDPKSVMRDLVRRSVDRIGISSSTQKSTVVVPDVHLSGLPMNLLRLENEFMGALHPIAVVPSLAWLATRAKEPRVMSGQRIAWVSDALPHGDESPALGPLADRLEPIATEHGFVFSRSSRVPRDLSHADVAIVTAHGGLLPDERFFQVVRDDANERWSPRSIADAVAHAGCVVLFVCSAGRHDEHPRSRAAVGLARLLLAEQVQAVVASPWPLDTKVPPRWLPTFLDRLDRGDPVSDATHAANMEVAHIFSGNPPHAFAMHVYGDPTYRSPTNLGKTSGDSSDLR